MRRPEGKNVKKIKTWICLTVASGLALVLGSRLAEAVALDPDNLEAR